MRTVGAGWDRVFTLERNGILTKSGYLVNAILLLTCLFALTYPAFNLLELLSLNCPFKSITGLPCPGCGYTRSIESLITGDIFSSFMHNPGWIILIFFMVTMIVIGMKTIIKGRQVVMNNRWLIMFVVLLGSTWIGKFILGSVYY